MTGEPADVAIIGAGVVGTAIARTLAGRDVRCVLIDAASDVGTGTTKANTAILHTGFDAVPGSLESRLLRRGSDLLHDYARRAGIAVERTGALLIAWTAEQEAELPALEHKAHRNGCADVRRISVDELYRRESHLGPGAVAALEVPGESVVCPWTTPLAYATQALALGARLRLGSRVTGFLAGDGLHRVVTTGGEVRARWVVNAAGLQSDHIDRMLGGSGFTITPRRGELIVFDKLARPLLRSILLPVPTARTKGVLVAPTVYGNVLLGPTADDVPDRSDTATTAAGLASLLSAGRRILPRLAAEEVTAAYAGLRAATEHRDYQIRADPERRYVCVAGIRSTGLSASLGIAEYVACLLDGAGLAMSDRAEPDPSVMPYLGEAGVRPYADPARIAADPEYGAIVCHCERVTRGEIRDALASPLPPSDLAGLRRRTRVLNGRCQGFYCSATVRALFEAGPRAGLHRVGTARTPRQARREPARPAEARRDQEVGGVRNPTEYMIMDAGAPRAPAGTSNVTADVLVVGAGPAGLAAAGELRRLGAGRVLVVDRDDEPGGIPRHCLHTGFGIRDQRRFLTGPAYARRYVDAAIAAGADVRAGTTVTGWNGRALGSPHRVTLTSPAGVQTVEAAAVLLATGCRERPRTARLIPGDRPPGVMTTGELQRRVYLMGERLPGRALVVGAEHVSFSAVLTLTHAGAEVVALVTEHPRHSSYPAFALAAELRWHVPVWTSTVVRRVDGRERLTGVEVADAHTGAARFAACDILVFTGDWIPDHELARLAGLDIDPGTRGPAVDTALETSAPGVFAAGNLVHAAETADIAALGGRHAARHVAAVLGGLLPPGAGRLPVSAAPPLAWISPNALRLPAGHPAIRPARGRFVLRSTAFRRLARIEVTQAGRRLATTRPLRLIPGSPVHIGGAWVTRADPEGGPIAVRQR